MIRLLKACVFRVSIWRLNRQLDALEARFLEVRAEHFHKYERVTR